LNSRIDWKAIAMGGVVTVAVGILASVVAAVIDLPKDSNGWFVFFWIDVIGAGIGGFIAGRRRMDTPLMHGALVGACSYVVIAAFATTITLVAGHKAPDPLVAITGIIFLTLGGTVGGWVASARGQRARPSTDT
jgi:putative membrane protein (TIGR04086 family)